MLIVSKEKDLTCKADTLLKEMDSIDAKANKLSPNHHNWEIIYKVDDCAHRNPNLSGALHINNALKRTSAFESKDVVLKRRSAQMMDAAHSQITKEQFLTIVKSVEQNDSNIHLALFVHNVENLRQGLYFYVRNSEELPNLKKSLKGEFAWEEIQMNLYLLQEGDFRAAAKYISCNQDIAKDGAFSLGMLCRFATFIDEPQKYKELYYECGAIGQQLYLEATSLGINATGIGCFLDDVMHELLGIKDNAYQSLYHFTVGRAITDMRVQTLKPYINR